MAFGPCTDEDHTHTHKHAHCILVKKICRYALLRKSEQLSCIYRQRKPFFIVTVFATEQLKQAGFACKVGHILFHKFPKVFQKLDEIYTV